MKDFSNNLISITSTIRDALIKLNNATLIEELTLFVIDDNYQLIGTLTDGDIRRHLLVNNDLSASVTSMMCCNYYSLSTTHQSLDYIRKIKKLGIDLVPVIDNKKRIIKIINFKKIKSLLSIDAVLMAGGRGERLRPLTDDTPKPLLKVGNKPIIEHNIDNLIQYGVENFFISIKYLGHQIIDYFGSGENKGIKINYISEDNPLGTIGAISRINNFAFPNILVMNSDLFTNINFESLYQTFLESDADMAVATIPYNVNVPYAVLQEESGKIINLSEKPTFTYYSNAGIYIMKRNVLNLIPKETYYNATDLIRELIDHNYKVVTCPIIGYWVDIGRHEDYQKVQEFVKHL